MGSRSPSRRDRPDSRRRRSASADSSEEERQRRRRRRDREAERPSRSYRGAQRNGHDGGTRRGHDNRDGKQRRSRSPAEDLSRRKYENGSARTRYRSPDQRDKLGRSSREGSTQVSRKNNGPLPSQTAAFQTNDDPTALVKAEDQPEKQKPNFAPTGLLAAASNSIQQADGTAVVLKYHEPAEARKPPSKDVWKLFVFKGSDILDTIELSLRSCWLVGRELTVVDMPAEHPSISKQHAVIQFRYVEKTNEYGDKLGRVRPYLIDLESANGTLLNKEEVPQSRYLELRDKDMLQFGHSTREYVLMLSPKS